MTFKKLIFSYSKCITIYNKYSVMKSFFVLIPVLVFSCKNPTREEVFKNCALRMIRSQRGSFVSYEKIYEDSSKASNYKAFINTKYYSVANEFKERKDTIELVKDEKKGWKCK